MRASSHPLLRLSSLFRGQQVALVAGVVGLTGGTALNLAGPWLLAQALDVDIPAGDTRGLALRAAAYFGVLVGTFALTYGARIALEISAQEALVRLKERLFEHLLDHDAALHDANPSGKLITRVQSDTEALRVLFTEVILSLPADLVLFGGVFCVIAVSAPAIAPPVFAVLPPYLLLLFVFRRVAPPRFFALRKVRAVLTGFLTEVLRAMPTLQQLDRVGWADATAEERNGEVYRTTVAAGLVPVAYFNGVFAVRAFGLVLVLGYGALQVAEGDLTVGGLVMGLGYLRQMFNPLMRLSHHLSTLERARAAALRVGALLDAPRLIADPAEPVPWPGLKRALRLEDVHFAYTDDTPVLRGLDLEVGAGQRVGIVGATGAGKSTVISLLLRFRDPVSGRVTVDGVESRALAVSNLRRHLGLVLQDVHLFPGTVLDNLGGDRERAARALATLDLDMPLERTLLEGAAELSRGERQLLTFARALVDDPEILVLDEATSAVDPATESRVQEALERLQTGRTTVIVAHRLATVRDCDRIYVLGHGVVREQGTHDELIGRSGLYAALARLQGLAA